MNQSQVYICPLSLESPSHLPPHPNPLGCYRELKPGLYNNQKHMFDIRISLSHFTFTNKASNSPLKVILDFAFFILLCLYQYIAILISMYLYAHIYNNTGFKMYSKAMLLFSLIPCAPHYICHL